MEVRRALGRSGYQHLTKDVLEGQGGADGGLAPHKECPFDEGVVVASESCGHNAQRKTL